MADHPVLEAFSPAVRAWFAASFPEPTTPQIEGWPSILGGSHTLVCAPTGSGKTLTAFLASIDRLCTTAAADPKRRTRVLYISPLRALAFDIEKNLRAPLMGIGLAAERLGVPFIQPTVAMRTGDTSARDRQALLRHPVDLLITTPESLYLMTNSLVGTGVWSSALRYGDPAEIAAAAAELESLGYSALWIPDVGGDVFGPIGNLMAATTSSIVATGILNLWLHTAEETAEQHAALTAAHGPRFLVGIGVGHRPSIDRIIAEGTYQQPLAQMAAFLDALDAAEVPLAPQDRALAALGPKMLELAATRTAGAHPYLVTPEHSRIAREALGPDALVATEQGVVLETDPQRARAIARDNVQRYMVEVAGGQIRGQIRGQESGTP